MTVPSDDQPRRKVILGDDIVRSQQRPTIVGTIVLSDPGGIASLQLAMKGEIGVRPVKLYAWSDGIVTWTETRS